MAVKPRSGYRSAGVGRKGRPAPGSGSVVRQSARIMVRFGHLPRQGPTADCRAPSASPISIPLHPCAKATDGLVRGPRRRDGATLPERRR